MTYQSGAKLMRVDQRWYAALLLLFVAFAIVFELVSIVVDWWQGYANDLTRSMTHVGDALGIVALLWMSYVVPALIAADVSVKLRPTPRQWLIAMRYLTWSIPALLLLYAVGYAFICALLCWRHPSLSVNAACLPSQWNVVAVTISGPASLVMNHVLTRRFMASLPKRCICFDCGYDLRGNPDATACPECGWAIAWKKAS